MLPRLSGIESMSCCSLALSATAMHCRLLGGGTIVAIVRRLLDFPELVNKEVWRLLYRRWSECANIGNSISVVGANFGANFGPGFRQPTRLFHRLQASTFPPPT